MKIFKRISLALISLIVLGVIAGSIYIRHTSRKALPDYSKDVLLNNISENVVVKRDGYAMPHVYAKNESDLYRAVGYVMAQDRLWQMDLLRRLTLGRLSEIFGKDLVTADQLFRSLRFSRKSEMVLESLSPAEMNALQSFADGVNQFIDQNENKLPPEFSVLGYQPEHWKPLHTANLIGYMAWGLTMGWSTEVNLYKIQEKVGSDLFKELVPDLDMQNTYIYQDGIEDELMAVNTSMDIIAQAISDLGLSVFQASNNWVIGAEKSATGKPILANDMHLELNAPGIWYQMHQVVPGKLDVTGVVLPGQPFVICGHNTDVAWGMTNVMLDDMDFYMESINPDDSTKYLLDGEWKDLETVKEQIVTKEGDTVIRYNRFTHRGPIISDFKGVDGKAISMRWIGNEFSNELHSVYQFNRMKNWDDFREAASTFIAISQNIAYADKSGNIGMQTTAGIPVREGNGIYVMPGDTSLYDWREIVPFEELPFELNPEKGYCASANNRTIGDDYPYYISSWFDLPNRMERIVEMIEEKDKIDVEYIMKMQSDQTSKWAEKLVPYFIDLLSESIGNQDEQLQKAFTYLDEWDYQMDIHSVPSTIFEQFYIEFLHSIFYDELGEELYGELIKQDLIPAYMIDKLRITRESKWFDNVLTEDKVETDKDVAMEALTNTISDLKERLGTEMEKWEWGKVHTLTLGHPLGSVDVLNTAFKLNRGPYPVGGSYHTVSPYSYPFEDLYNANHGSSQRHIFPVSDWDNSRVIIPTGISGIPASPHYCDQTEAYINNRYKTDPFTKEAVEREKVNEMLIMPDNL